MAPSNNNATAAAVDPLQNLLSDVLSRLEVLESKAGVIPSLSSSGGASFKMEKAASSRVIISSTAGGEVPAVKAYDVYMKQALTPFADSCDALGINEAASLLREAWEGVRSVVVLASRSKLPPNFPADLQDHLPQEAVRKLQQLRLPREFDGHSKALNEILVCVSWVLCRAPKQLPSGMVKEAMSSAEFWTNRIRKDKKGDEAQMAFCNGLKKVVADLLVYIEEYHKTGLSFNPKGVSLAEAAILLTDEGAPAQEGGQVPASPKRQHPLLGNVVTTGNVAGLMGELSKRKNAEGSSAATGLKHVTKDQQTWRKEYSKDESKTKAPLTVPSLEPAQKPVKTQKKKPRGLPVFEYQDRGFKWVIENQTKETNSKVLTVEITDPKQQVYLYNCEGITVQINGKFKSLALDSCDQCAVVYDTLISSSELVNCQKIQLQVKGVCPVFTIDKTRNVLIWLSEESKAVSTFTTSLSSEMNVSFPEGGEQKETPIPEQFVHKIAGTRVSSEVSDLYH